MGAGHPEVSLAVDKPMTEQVHLEASVAVVMSVLQQVYTSEGIVTQGQVHAGEGTPRSISGCA